jgi:uncharacterized membrane protein YdjX (TVP38/TMEM64 family)
MNKLVRCLPILILLSLLLLIGWSWQTEGIVYDLFGGDADAATRVDRLKQYFLRFGAFAPLVYVLFVVVEVVVAPIPGLMLYAPGGIVFGPALGGTLSLIGNILGAGIACAVTRSLGNNWLTRFFEPDKLERVQHEIETRGALLIFLLRLNPLTSSDVVSYAAGLTRIPIWKVMLVTGCGMAPLCFAQAWLAENLITAFPGLIYPLLVACGVYMICVVVVVRRILRTAS